MTRNIANAAAKARAKTLRVKLLLRCNLLTYFKNFLSNLRPSGFSNIGYPATKNRYFGTSNPNSGTNSS